MMNKKNIVDTGILVLFIIAVILELYFSKTMFALIAFIGALTIAWFRRAIYQAW